MRQFSKSLFLITIILLLFKIISCNNVEIKTETKFTVTYESEYAKAPESIEVKENTVLSAEYLPILEEQGYFFEGWFDGSTKVEADKYKVTKNVILYANWSANSNIEYKIEHYQQNIENDEYTIFETESKTGTTNENTLAIAKSYEGFFAKDFEQLSIQPDGTTVVKIFYDRKFVTLTFNTDGGTEIEPLSAKYGSTIQTPSLPLKTGYTFLDWEPELPEIMPSEDMSFVANWSANSNIEYKIEHYQQNIENDEYTIFETESKTGTTNENTLAIAKSYEGFFAKDFEQLSIQPDGTTVVKIFYDRKFVTLTFNTDGGTEIEPLSAKYGSTIQTPSLPLKTGYTFLDWEPKLPEIMPSEDMLFVANWSANTLSLIIHAPKETDIPKLESPKISGTSLIFTAPCNYITYSWYLDGIVLTYSSSKTLILDTLNLNAGSHFIMLVVSDIVGNIYSSQYEIEVLK